MNIKMFISIILCLIFFPIQNTKLLVVKDIDRMQKKQYIQFEKKYVQLNKGVRQTLVIYSKILSIFSIAYINFSQKYYNHNQVQNMQEITEPIAKECLCPYKNKATLLCSQEICTFNALMCGNQQCKCYKDHQDCKFLPFSNFIKKIQASKQNFDERYLKALKLLKSIYEDTIKTLNMDLQQLMSKMEYIGYGDSQILLMKYLNEGKSKEIIGKMIKNAEIELKKGDKNLVYSRQQDVKKMWQIQNIEFNKIRNNLKLLTQKKMKFTLDSKIMKEEQIIRQFIGNPRANFNLLFRASENDFSVAKFHQKCDGKPNTITIALTEFGKIIGGFTPLKWNNTATNYLQDSQSKTFLFSVTNKEKYPIIQPQYAIYCKSTQGPTFGGGHDLCILDKSNTANNSSYANLPHSYNNGKGSYQTFSGSNNKYCKFTQWQVFQMQLI